MRRVCSRAFTAWAFHVRERHRLRKVRALLSCSRLESHASPELPASVHPCPLSQIALTCAKALTHRQLCEAVRSWREVLHDAQSFSVELKQGNSSRLRLGFAEPASMALPGFKEQMDPDGTSVATSSDDHPMPCMSLSPTLQHDAYD